MPSQQPGRTNRVRVACGPRALTAASDEYAAYAAYVTAKFDAYARTDAVVSRRLRVQTQYVRPVRWYSRVRCILISQRTVTWAPPVGGFHVNTRRSQRERAIRVIRRVRHCRHRDDASIEPPGSSHGAAGRIGHRRVTWRRLDGAAQPARQGVARERWIEQMTGGCIGYGIHERRKRDGRREACRRRRRVTTSTRRAPLNRRHWQGEVAPRPLGVPGGAERHGRVLAWPDESRDGSCGARIGAWSRRPAFPM